MCDKRGSLSVRCEYSRVAIQRTTRGVGKKYVVMIVRCSENVPLREIGAWEKVRYNGGYVVNGVRCNTLDLVGEIVYVKML